MKVFRPKGIAFFLAIVLSISFGPMSTVMAEGDRQQEGSEFIEGAPGAYCTDAAAPGFRPWRWPSGSADCPPWAACTVAVGDCNGESEWELPLLWSPPPSPPEELWTLDVCSGVCAMGTLNRLVVSAGGMAELGGPDILGGALSAEVIPRVMRGHVGGRVQWWTTGTVITGSTLNFPVSPSLLLGLAGDIHWQAGRWGLSASGRAEYFPWHLRPPFIPFQYFSLIAEAGALSLMPIEDNPRGFFSFGVRLWI